MLEDEITMSYNRHWGGAIPFPKEDWEDWFNHWIVNHEDKRFYRYLSNEGTFVGEIAYHYSDSYQGYMANIIIYAPYRHQGFGKEGLSLLCKEAKSHGVSVLYDDIAIDNPAIKLFLGADFKEEYRNEEIVLLSKKL